MNYKRIHIFGINGSGKSFLGNAISKKLNLRHVELDHIFWRNKYDDYRSDEECGEKLREVCKDENWVVEGVFTTWVKSSVESADLVILLDMPKWLLYSRNVRRFSKPSAKGGFKSFWILHQMIRNYKQKNPPQEYHESLALMKSVNVEPLILKSVRDINHFIDQL